MSPLTLAAAAVFAALGLAALVLATAVAGRPAAAAGPSRPRPTRRTWVGAGRRRVAAAVGVGLAVAVVTRWPVAALAAAGLIAAWPWLFGAARAETAALVRLEALATWTESLRDTTAAVGLEQAIPATVPAAPAAIAVPLSRLRGRLQARQPLPAALEQLAADLADPSADLVVAALLLNAGLRGSGLVATLSALAASAREEVNLRRRVEAGRRGIRQGARIVVGVTVGFLAALATFNRGYLAPYGTAAGELVLAAVLGMFAAGFAWLRHLSTFDMPARLFASTTPAVSTDRTPSRVRPGGQADG